LSKFIVVNVVGVKVRILQMFTSLNRQTRYLFVYRVALVLRR